MVETLDDLVRGKVIGFDGDVVRIRTSDGFQMQYEPAQLMRVETDTEIDFDIDVTHAPKKESFGNRRDRSFRKKKKNRTQVPMEVDLHIEKLISHPGQLGVVELLDFQLDHARKQLEFAIRKKISTMVFIHGVGEGVLKSELHSLFKRYPNLMFRDASFRKYGSGATEVLLTYPKNDYSSSS